MNVFRAALAAQQAFQMAEATWNYYSSPCPLHLVFNVHLWIFFTRSFKICTQYGDLKGNKMSIYGSMYLTLKYSILFVNFVTATDYTFEGFRTYYNCVDEGRFMNAIWNSSNFTSQAALKSLYFSPLPLSPQ